MASIVRDFFATSVSSSTVTLSRVPGLTPQPTAHPGQSLHQITVITGVNSAATADTGFWATGCIRYRVTIERIT